MLDKVKVAAAQIVPAFMKKDPTVQRVCDAIHKAAANGAQLIVFPETLIPGYPYWRSLQPVSRWSQLMVEYQKNALLIPSDDTARICEAAKKANIICAIGCTELSDRPGSQTLYNTILFVDNYGKIMGRHRKLMPTHAERTVWGMGDASDLKVFDTDIGRIGGLVCFEHHITLLKAALAVKGEEVHCAVWPGWWVQEKHPGIKRRWRAGDPKDLCDITCAIREYAFETQCFVVSASLFIPSEELPEESRGFDIAAGGSAIVNPTGLYLAEPVLDREEIVYATLDADERRAMKAYFDAVGHYSRWDVVSLSVREEAWEPVTPAKSFKEGDRHG